MTCCCWIDLTSFFVQLLFHWPFVVKSTWVLHLIISSYIKLSSLWEIWPMGINGKSCIKEFVITKIVILTSMTTYINMFILCNVKDVSPSKRLLFKSLIDLFLLFFWACCITIGMRALDSRVLLLQTGHHGIFAIHFVSKNLQKLKLKPIWAKIVTNLLTEFQILSRYSFKDINWGS